MTCNLQLTFTYLICISRIGRVRKTPTERRKQENKVIINWESSRVVMWQPEIAKPQAKRGSSSVFSIILNEGCLFPQRTNSGLWSQESHGVPIKSSYKAFHPATEREMLNLSLVFGLQARGYIKGRDKNKRPVTYVVIIGRFDVWHCILHCVYFRACT